MSNILIFDAISVLFNIISAYYYAKSAKIMSPKPPRKGEIIDHKFNENLCNSLREMGILNSKGARFIALSIVFQIISLVLKNL